MSSANAAAIRRRVNHNQLPVPSKSDATNTPQYTNQSIPQPAPKSLTLPQYMNTLDKRIKTLEDNAPSTNNSNTVFSAQVMDEFNSRFEILATELGQFKDALLKLQTFTMDVNKSLHDDRIHILSDIETQPAVNASSNTEEIVIEEDTSTSDNIKNMVEEQLNK
jgi:hypothetical protein